MNETNSGRPSGAQWTLRELFASITFAALWIVMGTRNYAGIRNTEADIATASGRFAQDWLVVSIVVALLLPLLASWQINATPKAALIIALLLAIVNYLLPIGTL